MFLATKETKFVILKCREEIISVYLCTADSLGGEVII
jgi:hypothetical protein